MAREGHDWGAVWTATCDVICKSLLAVAPATAHNYRALLPPTHGVHACFELLGSFRGRNIFLRSAPLHLIGRAAAKSLRHSTVDTALALLRAAPGQMHLSLSTKL